MNPVARRHARQYALQAMYQWLISGASSREIENQFIEHQITKTVDLEYFKELIHRVPESQAELDQKITPYSKRPLGELDPIELAILRMATYEFLHRLDIPYRVVLNEALELTKKFGSVDGYKFVNGVLDQIARQTRQVEVERDTKKK